MFVSPLQCPVAGDGEAAVNYCRDRLLPVINDAMTRLCFSHPVDPLKTIERSMKSQSELRTSRAETVRVTFPPLPQSAEAPVSARKNDAAKYAPNAEPLDLKFENRPCLIGRYNNSDDQRRVPVVLPRTFSKCDDYPVYVSELPTRAMLQSMVKVIRENEPECTHITWLLVSTESTVLTFMGEQPYKARMEPSLWARKLSEAAKLGHNGSAVMPPVEAFLAEGHQNIVLPKTTPRHKKSTKSAMTPRTPLVVGKQNIPFDDVAMEQLLVNEVIGAVGRKGNAASIVDYLRNIVQASFDNDDATSETSVQEGRSSFQPQENHCCTVLRMFHASNVAVCKSFVDDLMTYLGEIEHRFTLQKHSQAPGDNTTRSSNNKNIVVLLSCDQQGLMEHVSTLVCLYYRTKADIVSWRNILNATEKLRDRNYVYDFEKIAEELRAGREKRDGMRQMLVEAQVNILKETGLIATSNEYVEQRRQVSEQHEDRRRREDERRNALDNVQGSDAAIRVQSIMRGAITRRRTNGVLRKKKQSIMDFEGPYRRGRYPIIEATMEYLTFVFGPQLITSEPMKRGSTKTTTRWKRSKVRVPPYDEQDISSEEELWEEEVYEKLSSEGTGAINPLHMADVALSAAKSKDKEYLFEIFKNYNGIPGLQEKATRCLERLVHYTMLAVFLCARHRIAEGNGFDAGAYASTNLLNMPTKLKTCESYHSFMSTFRRPQEWLNHLQFSLLLLSNVPQPLPRSRLLVANPDAPNGSSVEGVARVDVLLQGAPIFLVPEGSTTDQMAESVSLVQRMSSRCKKVLWVSTSPNFCVYVNGVPVHWVEKQKNTKYSPEAKLAADIPPPLCSAIVVDPSRKARGTNEAGDDGDVPQGTTLSNNDELLLETEDAMLGTTGAPVNASKPKLNPFAVQQSNIQVVSPRPSFSEASPKSSSSQGGSSLRRQSSIVSDASSALKKYEAGWYGVSWDAVELSLVDELIQAIDNPKADGMLKCFSVSTMTQRVSSLGNYMITTAGTPRMSMVATPGVCEDHNPNGVTSCLWDYNIQPVRFQPPEVAVMQLRVTQQPQEKVSHQTSHRTSRSSSLHVTPRSGGLSSQHLRQNSSGASSGDEHSLGRNVSDTGSATGTAKRGRNRGIGRRPSMTNSHKSSEAGDSSQSHREQEEELMAPQYPSQARDALRTPNQAVEDVKDKIKASGTDCSLAYRRLPLIPSFGDEWLKNMDSVLMSFRDNLVDPTASIVVCISNVDSVWHSLFCALLWEAEIKNVAPRKPASVNQRAQLSRGSASGALGDTHDATLKYDEKQFEAATASRPPTSSLPSTPPCAGMERRHSLTSPGPATAACNGSALNGTMTSNLFNITITQSAIPDVSPASEYPALRQLGDEVAQLSIDASVAAVIDILCKTGTREIIYDCIDASMRAADEAAAKKDWGLCKKKSIEATVQFEKFVLLVVFHSFVVYNASDASTGPSTAASTSKPVVGRSSSPVGGGPVKKDSASYFRDFVVNTPTLFHRLHHISPWDGQTTRKCPLGEAPLHVGRYVAALQSPLINVPPPALDGDHRWRMDTLMPSFS